MCIGAKNIALKLEDSNLVLPITSHDNEQISLSPQVSDSLFVKWE